MYSIKECLRGYTNDALGAMCERWNLVAGTKANRIRALEKILDDPLHVKQAVAQLGTSEVRLLNLLAQNPGLLASDLVSVPALVGGEGPSRALLSLATLGLVLALPQDRAGAFSLSHLAREEQGSGVSPALVLLMCAEGILPASPLFGLRLPAAPDTPTENSITCKDGAATALLETLRVVEVLGPRVTATGELHKTDGARARELAAEAGVSGEAIQFALLGARKLGCVEVKAGRLVTTDRAEKWAGGSRAQRTRDLFQAYISSDELPDLQLFFPQVCEAIEARMPSGSLRRRYYKTLAVNLLAEQEEGVWIPVDVFADAVRRLDENVLFLHERWRAIAAGAQDPSAAWRDRMWQNHERRLFQWMLQSLFANMGIVEMADEGRVFRVTGVGRYALGVGTAPQEAEQAQHDALVIQPDFEVIAYVDRCSPDLRRKLDVFCERLRGGPVSTYRLTQESVYRGVRAGVSTDELIRILEAHSTRALPLNVKEQFTTWSHKVASVTIRTKCRMLEYGSEQQALEAVKKNSELRHLGGRFVLCGAPVNGATHVRIDYSRPLGPCAIQKDGLTLHIPWERAHLFARRRLEELGEVSTAASGDLVFRLERGRGRRGVDWGLQAAQLETLVEGPLASRYRAALRAWSGEVGAPSALSATLIRFEDEETCEAALQLPEVARHVEGRLGLYTLVARKGGLPAIKQALKLLGMPLGKNGVSLDDGPPEQWVPRWIEARNTDDDQEEGSTRTKKEEAHSDEEAMELPSYSPRIVGEIIEDAIRRRRPILIQYQSTWSPIPTVRRVNPVTLDTAGAVPSLSGYCHRLGGARVFKLARISGIRVLEDESF
ncbi:MAG: helicase-associated domain-containing protein [Candidatus Hydrogenedentes bacterium]|nr:helicase-associated domain-containing protein [Candidatus Hydrogenedentota bacterium]